MKTITAISDRQLEIIEAAGRILSTSGVSGLTIKNLSRAMNFSESAIYRHFESKEEIVVSMLDYLATNMDERLTQVISTDKNAKENLENMFLDQFMFFSKYPHFVVAVFSDGLMEESQKINEAIVQIMQVVMKHLVPVVQKGQQQGIFTNRITTEDLVHIIMGTFRLLMFKWRVANFQFDISREGKNMLHALLTLIQKPSS